MSVGYKSYLSMLMVEHTHNNPSLRTFCQLLLDTLRHKRDGGKGQVKFRKHEPAVYVNESYDDKGLRVSKNKNDITLVSIENMSNEDVAANGQICHKSKMHVNTVQATDDKPGLKSGEHSFINKIIKICSNHSS